MVGYNHSFFNGRLANSCFLMKVRPVVGFPAAVLIAALFCQTGSAQEAHPAAAAGGRAPARHSHRRLHHAPQSGGHHADSPARRTFHRAGLATTAAAVALCRAARTDPRGNRPPALSSPPFAQPRGDHLRPSGECDHLDRSGQLGSLSGGVRVRYRAASRGRALRISGRGLQPHAVSFAFQHTADYDSDGLENLAEIEAENQTDPLNPDSDGDGLPDGWEVSHDPNPNDATGSNGASGDPDQDGLRASCR